MAQVPLDLNVPFRPIVWPQDTLAIPQGNGQMPEVDYVNASKIKREFFSYAGSINMTGVQVGSPQVLNINTQKDGDFWISSMTAAYSVVTAGPSFALVIPDADLIIVDSVNQYSFFTPVLPFAAINRGGQANTGTFGAPNPDLFTSNIAEPYCIMRGGNISITLTLRTAIGNTQTAWFCFNGWKEYANAAR